jgi:hypothetical protein
LVVIGFADKKAVYTYFGWSVLMVVGLISLWYNLFFIDMNHYPESSSVRESAGLLISAGWLNVAGTVLALSSLLFFYFKKKRYLLLAVLTVIFFSVQFFQYYSLIQKPK